jgi:hypothetical protein
MAVEHPLPTTGTVKLLYAHAFACAYPGCDRPLYREDEAAGAWTLNSRICHIHARRERGPRWDPQQSAEDNRAEQNLLLLCLEHASAIDDQRTIAPYPAALLKSWKQAQIADHRQRMEGWPLTNAMTDQAIETSFSDVGIAINHSTIELGGRGGQDPSAGGGGGGAIGRGARAGRGGDGGKHHNFRPEPSSSSGVFEDILEQGGLSPEQMPGAGGVGAGAIGENAVAGDGGNGGDRVSCLIAVEPGDVYEYEVAKGGKGGGLPGQHAEDGGGTVFRIRSADGVLKRVVRAQGGKGPRAGQLPDGAVEISKADLAGGFQVSSLLSVNAAEIRDGLLFILGGGWGKYSVPKLPFDVIWQFVCTTSWSSLDPFAARWLQLCVLDPQGVEVSRIAFEVPLQVLKDTGSLSFISVGVSLNNEGLWVIRVQSGGFLLSQIGVSVKLIPIKE